MAEQAAPAEIIAERAAVSQAPAKNYLLNEVAELLARHPATFEEIVAQVNNEPQIIEATLKALLESGAIAMRYHQGKKFYVVVHDGAT